MADHEGHVSVTRVADMLNLGRNAVRLVPSRPDFTMDVEQLDQMLAADRARGDLPFCVVAQLGSVNVGAVDPMDALADVCAKHGVWLHGDGACGLLAAGLPETRALFRGLERADSLSFDAHKWLGVPYDCGVVLVRHGERLRRAFSIAAPYLRGSLETEDAALDYLEYGPADVARLPGAQGLDGASLLRRSRPAGAPLEEPRLWPGAYTTSSANTRTSRCFTSRRSTSTASATCRTAWRSARRNPRFKRRLDRLNEEIVEAVQRSGLALVMTTRIRGRVAIRMSICSHRTLRGGRRRDVRGHRPVGASAFPD